MEFPIQIWIIGGEEGQKGEGRDCHSLGRSLTNSAASRAEEDAEEAALETAAEDVTIKLSKTSV